MGGVMLSIPVSYLPWTSSYQGHAYFLSVNFETACGIQRTNLICPFLGHTTLKNVPQDQWLLSLPPWDHT
jgi:hypothetical protein